MREGGKQTTLLFTVQDKLWGWICIRFRAGWAPGRNCYLENPHPVRSKWNPKVQAWKKPSFNFGTLMLSFPFSFPTHRNHFFRFENGIFWQLWCWRWFKFRVKCQQTRALCKALPCTRFGVHEGTSPAHPAVSFSSHRIYVFCHWHSCKLCKKIGLHGLDLKLKIKSYSHPRKQTFF